MIMTVPSPPVVATVAQSANAQQIMLWSTLLIALVVVGGIIIFAVRRLLTDTKPSATGGFTLQELRNLRATGDLTHEHYEAARDMVIGSVKSTAGADEVNPTPEKIDPPEEESPGKEPYSSW